MAILLGSRPVLKVLALFLCVPVAYAQLTFNNYSEKSSSDAPLVPAFIIFGDSTVDAGNNNYLATVVKSDFEPYGRSFMGGKATGRFCDGLLAIDYIYPLTHFETVSVNSALTANMSNAAAKIGLPQLQLPYLAPNAHGEAILTGINFASSASGWDDDTAEHFNVKGLNYQFEWFKNYQKEVLAVAGPQKGNFILSNALYAFSTGANDWVNNYFLNPVLMKEKNIDQYEAFLLSQSRKYIQELYSLGGRNIAVLSLPPLGCLPSQITLHGEGKQGCIQEFNDICLSFNKALIAQMDEMKANMPGSRLLYVDIYTYLNEVFHNPTPYGFTETRTACCGTGDLETAILCNEASIGTCSNAYPFLFFDSFHPTTHFNSQLADQVFAYARPIILGPPQP